MSQPASAPKAGVSTPFPTRARGAATAGRRRDQGFLLHVKSSLGVGHHEGQALRRTGPRGGRVHRGDEPEPLPGWEDSCPHRGGQVGGTVPCHYWDTLGRPLPLGEGDAGWPVKTPPRSVPHPRPSQPRCWPSRWRPGPPAKNVGASRSQKGRETGSLLQPPVVGSTAQPTP